jgi:phage FluMu protein Com
LSELRVVKCPKCGMYCATAARFTFACKYCHKGSTMDRKGLIIKTFERQEEVGDYVREMNKRLAQNAIRNTPLDYETDNSETT